MSQMEQESIFLRGSRLRPSQTRDPHLDRFLRDVLVHLGGGILVQAVQEDLSQEERGEENG